MALLVPRTAIRLCSKPSAVSLSHGTQLCEYSDEPIIIKNPTTANLKRGTGGRSSFSGIVATVFGASGFVGKVVCNRLGKIGSQLIVPYRGEHYDVKPLKLCGDLGQVLFHPFDLRDEESIYNSVKYSNVVINLIGRSYNTRRFSIEDVNVEGARTIARICKQCGVERLIHLSALAANPDPKPLLIRGGSRFLRAKWDGEEAVREEFPDVTVIRPSVIYGQQDHFLNNYMAGVRGSSYKAMPMWKKGEESIKQPVYVGDVAAGITAIAKDPKTIGKTYQFLGPERFKLGELVDWFINLLELDPALYGYRRTEIEDDYLFSTKVALIEALCVSGPMYNLHWEAIEWDHTTDVPQEGLLTLEDLGITPVRMQDRVYWELKAFRRDIHVAKAIPESELAPPPQPVG